MTSYDSVASGDCYNFCLVFAVLAIFAHSAMKCRDHCGACCTAPSITSLIPGMPNGKPAGVRCVQLADDNRCRIFGDPSRPAFCAGLQPSEEMCGADREYALRWLGELERATAPS